MRNKGSRWHQSEKHQNDGFVLKEGDDMKIGIIGSGRVGYSMGKYMQDHGIRVTGFYDRHRERALDAAQFTGTGSFDRIEDLVAASDTLFLTVSDGAIEELWDCIAAKNVKGKVVCHFSGSLSSDIFSAINRFNSIFISSPIMEGRLTLFSFEPGTNDFEIKLYT